MKKILYLLLACLMASCGDTNTKYVKNAIRIMDKNGIYAQGPEWDKARSEALSAKPATLEEAQEIVSKACKVAGGKHSFLMTAEEAIKNDTMAWGMPTVKLLEDGVALIKLEPFSGNAEEGVKYAKTILDALPQTLKGVIIDLRGNRGGNMNPMIAAVHRFLPDDIILRFSSRKKPIDINTYYVLRNVGIEKHEPIQCPVALLTDEWTGSSGEAVLLCFRGMENTRSFGAPTAGYASCNQPFTLSDGSSLVLTIGEDIARTGERFCDDPIPPDITTETPVETALEWISDANRTASR
ncbi:MAG: S41 family peptidase [Bacteroidales bacterium]|nr:S41 family peptidase [Bacteroidales bacterium]